MGQNKEKTPFEIPYDAETDTYIAPLSSSADLDAAIAKYGTVILDAVVPWCPICTTSQDHFIKVAGVQNFTHVRTIPGIYHVPLPLILPPIWQCFHVHP